MKQGILIILFLCLYIGQAQHSKSDFTTIENKYQIIRDFIDDAVLQAYHNKYTCEKKHETGTLTFYYNRDELKHILHTYTQNKITYTDKYYIWDDILFFGLSTQQSVLKNISSKDPKKLVSSKSTQILEKYFYFKNQKAIKCELKHLLFKNGTLYNHTKNDTISCEASQEMMQRFETLCCYQKEHPTTICNLPKTISQTTDHDHIAYHYLDQE